MEKMEILFQVFTINNQVAWEEYREVADKKAFIIYYEEVDSYCQSLEIISFYRFMNEKQVNKTTDGGGGQTYTTFVF